MALRLKIFGDATHFEKVMRGVRGSINGIGDGVFKVAKYTAYLGGALGGVAVAFAKISSDKASEVEDLAMQFETLTKSASATKKLMSDFRKEAAKSPLSIRDYAQAGKTLMAFGMAQDSVMPSLRAIGDISMGNSERFASLSLAFAQTQAAGRLMGQEVLQFVNAGFNPLQEISKRTGESMLELKKRMEDGAISAEEVAYAFETATSKGGTFYQAIEKGANTTSGKIAKVKDAVDQLQIAFGTGMNEGLKVALDSANGFLPKLEGIFTESGQVVGKAIEQAVTGNMELFGRIGSIIGTAMWVGIKAVIVNGLDSLGSGIWNQYGKFTENMTGINAVDLLKDRTGIELAGKGTNLSEQLSSSLENSDLTQQLVELRKINQASQNMIKEQQNAARLLMDMQNVITPRFAN